jgi:hypothetical protein
MHDKGILTDAEYQSALADIGASTGQRAEEANSLVVGKWSATLYGFVEGDYIVDSTQSFADLAGNALVARGSGFVPPPPAPQSLYAGNHARSQFSVRNTRFGLRLRAPETHGVRASGTIEMDFLGGGGSPTTTEAAFFTSPTLRLRHAYFRVETPIVDVLVGQYWHMFGWQSAFFPASVEIQGLPGELYSRTPQLRLSHKFGGPAGSIELAVAGLRPPTRDGAVPEVAGGVRATLDKWRGMQSTGSTSTGLASASIAVTGDFRYFRMPEFQLIPTATRSIPTGAIAVDAFLPIIPATPKRHGNSLSVSGEFVYGGGISDLYTGLTGGMQLPSLPNTTGLNPAPVYPQSFDNGTIVFDNGPNHDPHVIVWQTLTVGLQYYLPGALGKVWLAANYSHTESPNIQDFTNPATTPPSPLVSSYVYSATVRKSEDFFDANLFIDPLPSVRIGLEYAYFGDHYVDGVQATNHRAQVSGFFLF